MQHIEVRCSLAFAVDNEVPGCTWPGLQDTTLRKAHTAAQQHVEHTGHETHVIITTQQIYGGKGE